MKKWRPEILHLAQAGYVDYNDSHFTEELAEHHQIEISRPTVRRIRREHGLPSPRKRRAPKHRRRRQRYPRTGMLLQVDGSKHDWLEGRGPWLTLHAAIDDATNEVPWAVSGGGRCHGLLTLLHHISLTHGLPLALYADRHTIFERSKDATLLEQLEGQSHVPIWAASWKRSILTSLTPVRPKPRGGSSVPFQTFQDRLVKELRRAEARTLAEANECLKAYLPRFNHRFMKPPAEAGSAYRPRGENRLAGELSRLTTRRNIAWTTGSE